MVEVLIKAVFKLGLKLLCEVAFRQSFLSCFLKIQCTHSCTWCLKSRRAAKNITFSLQQEYLKHNTYQSNLLEVLQVETDFKKQNLSCSHSFLFGILRGWRAQRDNLAPVVLSGVSPSQAARSAATARLESSDGSCRSEGQSSGGRGAELAGDRETWSHTPPHIQPSGFTLAGLNPNLLSPLTPCQQIWFIRLDVGGWGVCGVNFWKPEAWLSTLNHVFTVHKYWLYFMSRAFSHSSFTRFGVLFLFLCKI